MWKAKSEVVLKYGIYRKLNEIPALLQFEEVSVSEWQ